MCEITRSEFNDAFPYICEDIRNAEFIAFDAEFTGLSISEKERSSLFDSGEARYQKLRRSFSQFMPCQIGLSAFIKKEGSNTYMVRTYNFYLYPVSFGPIDVRFVCQASSLEFLCRHNFDFNKFVYDGVPYLNETQEKIVKHHLDSKASNVGLDRDIDEQSLSECCSLVAEWVVSADEGDILEAPGPEAVSDYVTLNELRLRFPDTWTTIKENGQIVVEKVSETKRKELYEAVQKEEGEKVLNGVLGFTRIFRLLTELKKPLVGHNCFTDLIILYEKFHKTLPESYAKFKSELHDLFPHIYDTKHIVNTIRRKFDEKIEKSGLFEQTSLSGLFRSLESDKGRFFVLYSPGTVHDKGFDRYKDLQCPHEAGYDAFMCGKVFLRLAHVLALKDKDMQQLRPQEFYEHVAACKTFRNSVNFIRGSTDYVKLDGADPPSRRPQYLYVRSRRWNSPLNSSQVAQMFSAYGCVDIQMTDRCQALVALGNHGVSRDILKNFRNHELIHVCKYSTLKHSPVVRKILWSGVALSGAVCVWALWTGLKER